VAELIFLQFVLNTLHLNCRRVIKLGGSPPSFY
jgi:hypothetical protein